MVWTILDHGQEQYMTFIEERFEKRTKLLSDPVKSNKLPLFSNQVCRLPTSVKNLAMLKNDCSLFSRLYIACPTREGNLEEFFKHENQPWPPSLSMLGQLRGGTKADLLACLTLQKTVVAPSANTGLVGTEAVLPEDLSDVQAEAFDDTNAVGDEPEDIETLIDAAAVLIPASVPEVDAKVLDGAAVIHLKNISTTHFCHTS